LTLLATSFLQFSKIHKHYTELNTSNERTDEPIPLHTSARGGDTGGELTSNERG